MQKNKSFQKPSKPSKQSSNMSSKGLLELSQIPIYSKEKQYNFHHMTDRQCNRTLNDFQSSITQLLNQNSRPNSKKQSYIKKNISLSNTVLKEIMQISDVIDTNNSKLQYSTARQNVNDLVAFSKQNFKKANNSTQTKINKKLLLYDNQETGSKGMSKSKSYHGKLMKAEGILSNIRIQPIDQKKGGQNSSIAQKRDSFDGRRSSFGSRRSSINLFSQEDLSSDFKMKVIRKSFLAKMSFTDANILNQQKSDQKVQKFLKMMPETPQDQKQEQNQNPTCENDTQVTHRYRQSLVLKLDELSIIEEDIKKDSFQFIQFWETQIQTEKNIKKYQKSLNQIKNKNDEFLNQQKHLNSRLFEQNKIYVINKRTLSNNHNAQKQNILSEVQKIHMEVKKKVFKKDLQDMMIFNMKVVLPSAELIESSVSCLQKQINTTLNLFNIPILQIYEQLINQKACKKYGMILKKQINNMNIYDNRTMNEYLKKLYELEQSFHKVHAIDPQRQIDYLDRVQSLIKKIEATNNYLSQLRIEMFDIQRKINDNQERKQSAIIGKQNLLKEMSEVIYSEYTIFQTGGNNQTGKIMSEENSDINLSFAENNKTVEEFRELLTYKYQDLFSRYKQVKQQKKVIEESLKVYQQR